MNHTATLPIHITPHHLSLTPAICAFVHRKFATVPRFAGDVLAADVVLRRHHGKSTGKRFSASARLALPGRDIHAAATDENLYAAILELTARLARRSRKRKARLAKTHTPIRAGSASASPAMPAPSATPEDFRSDAQERAAIPADDPRRREGGQELRVFGFRRRSPFACAPDSRSEPALHDD